MSALVPVTPGTAHQLVVAPHPLTAEGRRSGPVVLAPGETLATLLQRQGVEPGLQWLVEIDGLYVPDEMWRYTRPKHGTVIECRRVPEKGVLRLVALAAFAYFAPWMAGTIGIVSKIGVALFTLAGTMVINRLLGPPRLKAPKPESVSPTYNIGAARNQARLFEPMGLVLGEPYCVPDLASQAFTYFQGEDVYLTQVFHAGLNCHAVSNVRIGQTSIGAYEAVQLFYDGFSGMGNTGLPSGSVDSIAGALLDAPADFGPYVTRTSSTNTVLLAVDLEASLYYTNDDASVRALELHIDLEWRPVGAPTWLPFVGDSSVVVLVHASQKPYRVTYTKLIIAPGQYEVRARKRHANRGDNRSANTITWTQLKSYQLDTGVYGGQARLGVNIKASGQLNGALDELNWRAQAKPMPVWTGASWATATDRSNGLSNPGAIFLLLCRGIWDGDVLLAGLGWDDARIDIEGLKLFMVRCAAKGFKFDLFMQEARSIGDLLEAVAYAGMATLSFHTGRIGVIWMDEDAPVEGVVNMANMKARSFSVEYATGETADEVVLSYLDRARGDTWQSVRVIAPGVTTPNRSTAIQLVGVTEESQAALLARFVMGQNLYLRKAITFEQDLEHMAYHRATVLALSHDLTQWGYGGRLRDFQTGTGDLVLTLDDLVPSVGANGETTRFIGLRLSGEAGFRVFPVKPFVGPSRTLTLDVAWPVGATIPGTGADNPVHDCLWIFDFKSTPGQRVTVTSVEPQANMSGATTVVAPMPDEFWPYVWTGAYQAPPNTSQLQPLPALTNLVVTEELKRQGNAFYADLTLTFDVSGSYSRAEVWGALGGAQFQKLGETTTRSFTWSGGLSESWVVELRPFSQYGRSGARAQVPYTVVGLNAPPPAPARVALSNDTVFWSLVDYIATAGYRVRATPGNVAVTPAAFARATPLYDGLVQSSPWPLATRLYGTQTVMVVTENSNGKMSAPVGATFDFGLPVTTNYVQSRDYQAAGFPGVLTNCSVVGGNLVADADPASDIDALADLDSEPDLDAGLFLAMTYIAEIFVPLYSGTVVCVPTVAGGSQTFQYRKGGTGSLDLDSEADLDAMADMDGGLTELQPFPGALTVDRGGWIQLQLTVAAGAQQGVVSSFPVYLAAREATQRFTNLAIAAGGTRLAPSAGVPSLEWISVTALSPTPIIDGSGAYGYRVNADFSPTLGPLLELVDQTGASVAGRATIEVKGLINA